MELNVARGRHVRDVVTDRLPSCDRVPDVGDTSGDVLITPECRVAKVGGRVGHSLAKFRSQPWGEQDREARANDAARQQPNQPVGVYIFPGRPGTLILTSDRTNVRCPF